MFEKWSRQRNAPPVSVKLSVSKLKKLSHEVHTGVKKPIEEDEPDQMIGYLWRQRGGACAVRHSEEEELQTCQSSIKTTKESYYTS